MDDVTPTSRVGSNELILTEIFAYLPLKELKAARLVCQLWADTARPMFRSKAVAHIHGVPQFVEAFANIPANHVPFINYSFILCLFHPDTEAEAGTLATFWSKFGASIETLELLEVRIVGVELVRDILFRNTPNLKSISVKDCYFFDTYSRGDRKDRTFIDDWAPLDENVRVNRNLTSFQFSGTNGWDAEGWVRNQNPITWEEIFIAYPNLKDFSLQDEIEGDTGIPVFLHDAMSLKRRNPDNIQWQKLHIFNGENADNNFLDVEHIIALELSLKELTIGFGMDYVDCGELLRQQRDNLLKLTLYGSAHAFPLPGFFCAGVTLDHLRHLEVAEKAVNSLKLLELMPNLTTFAICEPPYFRKSDLRPTKVVANTDTNFFQTPILSKLTTLKIKYQISNADVQKLIFWFPGLTKVKLYLDNESFRSICGGWRNLVELEVYGGNLTTEGITGIYELSVRKTRFPKRELNPVNITCLTDLRQFIMTNNDKPTPINDVSVDDGFMKLRYLNHLKLCSEDISDDGWEKLSNWEQLLTLEQVDPDYEDEDEEDC